MLRQQGIGEQDAYNAAAKALISGYKEWDEIVARVSHWDSQAVDFVEICCKPVVLGVLNWRCVSFFFQIQKMTNSWEVL